MGLSSGPLSSQDPFLTVSWLSHRLWLPIGRGRKARGPQLAGPSWPASQLRLRPPQAPCPLLPALQAPVLVEVLECPPPPPSPFTFEDPLSPACLLPCCSLGSIPASLPLPPGSLLGFLQAIFDRPFYVLRPLLLSEQGFSNHLWKSMFTRAPRWRSASALGVGRAHQHCPRP